MLERLKPMFKVWLEKDGIYLIGKEEAKILEGIKVYGSFMATAKALGISYAYAWNSVDKIAKLLGKEMVRARKGGYKGGGGAELTKDANKLLKEYKNVERKVANLLGNLKEERIFSKELEVPDFAIIGSNCVGINIIIELMRRKRDFSYGIESVGSTAGLTAIMLNECDVAGIHLLDEVTGEYNIPLIRRYHLNNRVVLVRGYRREQGLIVGERARERISGLEDLVKSKLRIVNRNLGSGTRTLFDFKLRNLCIKEGLSFSKVVENIKGYDVELKSHIEVAKAVYEGRADVGFGIKTVAKIFNLEFIPVAEEWFDFIIDKRRMNKPLVKLFLKILASNEFKQKLRKRTTGLKATKDTGKVIEIS
jgi:putative molybdopterin biosynthesis protein